MGRSGSIGSSTVRASQSWFFFRAVTTGPRSGLHVLEPEPVALAHHAAEGGRGEVRGAHQHVLLAVAVEEGAAGGRGPLGGGVGARRPGGLEALHPRGGEIAREHRPAAPRRGVHAPVVWGGAPRRSLAAHVVAG